MQFLGTDITPTQENGEALLAAQQEADPATTAMMLGAVLARQARVVKALQRQLAASPKAVGMDSRVLLAAISATPRV